jgi:glutamate/tyrosine decarboxylase-like PLP-dependent enzyme
MAERTRFRKLSEQDGFKNSFLSPNEDNTAHLIAKLNAMFQAALGPGRNSGRRGGGGFRYAEAASGFAFPSHGLDPGVIATELGACFEGSIRWHDPNAAFNITPAPDFDAVAAATLAMLLNPNCLWDVTSGHWLLAEQKIARALGAGIFPGAPATGFSTFGGKATLMYGIKMGLAASDRAHKRQGLKGGHVVLASAAAHYSLEDVADYLGLGTSAVLRIPCDSSGSMDPGCFEAKLEQCLAAGNRVAAVIVNGGATIDFPVDDASRIKAACRRKEVEHHLDYAIHLHGDTVAGWAWLFADDALLQDGSRSSQKVLEAKKRLTCIQETDSAGVDFHKTGLCPYSTTFFILKRKERLPDLGGHQGAPNLDCEHGDLHLHHLTLENSRAATGIAAAYASVLKLGRDGLTRYLRHQQEVRELYENLIESRFSGLFTILNRASLGFEIVLAVNEPNGKPISPHAYLAIKDRLWKTDGHDNTPIIGFVPHYQTPEGTVPAFLIYPMSPHTDPDACLNLLLQLREAASALVPPKRPPTAHSFRPDLVPPR